MGCELGRADWMLVDGACYAYSLVTVPLYDTLGPDVVRYVCCHAELAAVACSAECLATLESVCERAAKEL